MLTFGRHTSVFQLLLTGLSLLFFSGELAAAPLTPGTPAELDLIPENQGERGTSEGTKEATVVESEADQAQHATLVDDTLFLAVEALRPLLRPDTPNGLIRIALLPLRPVGGTAPPLSEAISRRLEGQLRLQPHLISPPPRQVRSVSVSLDTAGLRPVSTAQAISTARLLGVRYLLRGALTTEGDSARLDLELFSVRQRASVHQARYPISRAALYRFSVTHLDQRRRSQTALRSLLLPGWGQIHHGDLGRGILYGALSLGLFGAAVGSTALAYQAANRYQRNENSNFDSLDEANRWFGHASLLWLGLGTVWGASVLDAWLTSRDETRIRLSLDPQGGASLSGRF